MSAITAITPGHLPGQWNVFRQDQREDTHDLEALPDDARVWLERVATRHGGILAVSCL